MADENSCCVESKLAAARLDFVELLAGDGAVFLVFSRRPKWSKVRERAHPAHMCDCEPLIYVSLTAVGHRLRSTYFRLLMVYLFKPRSAFAPGEVFVAALHECRA